MDESEDDKKSFSIDISDELYSRAEQLAAESDMTTEEFIVSCVVGELNALERLNNVSTEKALSSLRKFAKAGEGDPIEGDELPNP